MRSERADKTMEALLQEEFTVERALLPSGLPERVMMGLPKVHSPLLRAARAMTGVVLLAALGCVALLAAQGMPDPSEVLRLVAGMGIVTLGTLLSFAAPRLDRIDARWVRRLTGHVVPSNPLHLVVLRAVALLVILLGAAVMHGNL